nr:hypothetical protein [Frankia sp. Cas3]
MRTIPVKLVSRYEAEGWWTPDTIGDLLTRGLAAVVRCKVGHPMPTLDQVRAHFDRCGLARQKWPQELHAVDDFPRPARATERGGRHRAPSSNCATYASATKRPPSCTAWI